MAAPERNPGPGLRDRLFREFYRFSFFRAVRLLEAFDGRAKPLGETLRPSEEPVRFRVRPGFAFPPNEIEGLAEPERGGPPELSVAFLGLIGPSGVLPDWYNELAQKKSRRGDRVLVDFLDLFHHRLVTLFYLAWKKYRFPDSYRAGGGDRLSRHLLSLIGLGTPGLLPMIGLPAEALTYCTGHLSRTVASAAAIEGAVAYLAGTDAQVEQFIERRLPLAPEDQTQVGMANALLGEETVCGSFVWERQTRFRVHLGPMGYAGFLRFLPDGDMLRPIFALVRYMVGVEFEFEIRVHLRVEETPPPILGAASPEAGAVRLGWAGWSRHPDLVMDENPYVTFPSPEP